MNKILLIGSKGQLGTSFVKVLTETFYWFIALDLPKFDLTTKEIVRNTISEHKPSVIINCAAYTNVAKAEDEIEKAVKLNGTALKYLSEVCNEFDVLLCNFSTDYVFDGETEKPYTETDEKNPKNIYGLSKYIGENLIQNYCNKYLIIRTAALFGENSYNTNSNIIEKFIHLGMTHPSLSVVTDEFTSPTFSDNLSEQTMKIIEHNLTGIFHATSEGYCNWLELAEHIFTQMKIETKLVKVSSKEFNKKMIKPAFSVLENKRLKEENINIILHWKDAVDKYLEIRKREN